MEAEENEIDSKTCAYCGYKSKLIELFVFKRPSRKEKPIEVCPGCQTKIDDYDHGYLYAMYFFLITSTLFFVYFRPDASSTWILANIVFYFICSFFSLVFHELGHVAAAIIQGGIVPKIVFGKGNILVHFEINDTEIEIRENWIIGLTYLGFDQQKKTQTRKYFIAILAGPLTNLLIVILSLVWIYNQPNFHDITTTINLPVLLIIVNSVMFLSSIYPHKTKGALGFDSDGQHLLDLFNNKPKKLDIFHRQYFLVYLHHLLNRREFIKGLIASNSALKQLPDDLYIKNIHGTFLIHTHQLDQAQALYQKEIEHLYSLDNTIENRMILAFSHNNLSYALYESNSTDSEKILQHAEIAYSIMPWEPSILQTYASALSCIGKHQDSIIFFNRALTFEQSDFSRSQGIASLALAYIAINKTDKAALLLHEVKSFGYNFPELERLEEAFNKLSCVQASI